MTRTLALSAALLLGACGSPLSKGDKEVRPDGPIPVSHGVVLVPELSDAFDAAALPILEKVGVGLGVAVVKDGQVLFTAGYGWSNLGAAAPLTADTPMQIGSVSKTFIAVAAMQAQERGDLTLDVPIADLVGFPVDNPRVEGDTITLKHLLTHTSGIEDSRSYSNSYADGDPTVSLLDFQRGYLTVDGEFYRRKNFAGREPGTFSYSNVGAALAGLGLGEQQNLEFADLVQRDILGPLGMTNSGYFLADLPTPPATNYTNSGRPWTPYSFPTYPDGLMRSSPTDLGRFLASMHDGSFDGVTLLSPEAVDTMLTVDRSIGTDDEGQAIGWAQLGAVEGRTLMGHTGGDPGVGAFLGMDRDAGVGVVFVVNQLDVDLGTVFTAYSEMLDLAEDAEL